MLLRRKKIQKRKVLVDKAFKYRCSNCNHEEKMWLEVALESRGKEHQPVPFTIMCPRCNTLLNNKLLKRFGFMQHVDWHKDEILSKPRFLTKDESYFEYDYSGNERACGIPHFKGKR